MTKVEIAKKSEAVEKLLTVKETLARTSIKRSTMYEMIRDGRFPRPVQLTPRCTAFVESEVTDWINERIAARCPRKIYAPL